jgi:hypothetical protein
MAFPAPAGMTHTPAIARPRCLRVPRTRGDDPRIEIRISSLVSGSPPARGHMTEVLREYFAFPARAGMTRTCSTGRRPTRRVPRTRGDDPRKMRNVTQPIPRTRGDDPNVFDAKTGTQVRSPHAGMTRLPSACAASDGRVPRTRGDDPAHFGVTSPDARRSPHARERRIGWRWSRSVPRTRGDDPIGCANIQPVRTRSSHARG